MKTLSLVIPTFNEEANLPELWKEIETLEVELGKKNVLCEFVVVDNDSTDTTWSLLKNWGINQSKSDVVLVQHPVNLGVQNSLLTGITHSTGDAIAVLQSDLQDPPSVVLEMVDKWLGGSTYVATRIGRRDERAIPKIGAWLFYRILGFVSDTQILFDSTDFYLFDAKIKKSIIKESGSTPFIRVTLASLAQPDEIITYSRKDRARGTSKFSMSRRVNFAMDAILRDLSGLVRKAIGFAVLIAGISVFSLIGLTVVFLAGYRSPVAGWVSTIGLLLVVLSTFTIVGAVTLELLSRIYRDLPRENKANESEVIRLSRLRSLK